MLLRIALAVLVFFLLSFFLAAYQKTPKNLQKQFLKNYGSLLAIAILLLLIATGKLNVLIGAVVSGALLIWRNIFLLKRFAPFIFQLAGKHTNFSPTIRTKHLKVRLEKGKLHGEVIEGELKGSKIDELSSQDIEYLSEYYKKNDKESLLLLHAYLQQQNSTQSQQQNYREYSSAEPAYSELSKKEALEILGLDESANRDDILAAHKKLIQRLHPDRGGSTYLAAKVNQAKDLLCR